MSALGQKQPFASGQPDVRFAPIAVIWVYTSDGARNDPKLCKVKTEGCSKISPFRRHILIGALRHELTVARYLALFRAPRMRRSHPRTGTMRV